MHPEVKTVAEFLAQEGLHQVQAPDDLHVLVPVPDLAYRAGQRTYKHHPAVRVHDGTHLLD